MPDRCAALRAVLAAMAPPPTAKPPAMSGLQATTVAYCFARFSQLGDHVHFKHKCAPHDRS
eukprot:5313692-Amphidinium_carterae.1